MAKLVLGIGTSHTPMLNAPAEDWPRFIDRDAVRDFLDKEGQPTTYEELLQSRRAACRGRIDAGAVRRPPRRGAGRGRPSQGCGAARRARCVDRRRRRPQGDLPRRQYAGLRRLLRQDDPQRAAQRLCRPRLGAAGDRALLRGKGAARLPGRKRPGAAPDHFPDRSRVRSGRLGRCRRARARAMRSPLSASG